MNFDQLNDSVERLIQNLEFIQSLEDEVFLWAMTTEIWS